MEQKLNTLRRNMMLAGVDTKVSEQTDKGKAILFAMQRFKLKQRPEMFSAESFARLVTDPLGKKKVLTPAEEKVERE